MRDSEVTGVVLAGGLSRRMGGGDKALVALVGQPMLGHVLTRFRPQVDNIVINANGNAERFEPFGLPVVADTIPEFPGPLAGILAGMRWARDNTPLAKYIATVSADAPLLPLDLVASLRAALTAEGGEAPTTDTDNRNGNDHISPCGGSLPAVNAIAMARSDGHLQPVIGLWPVALADDLEGALQEGVRKVLAWTDRHCVRAVDFAPILLAGTSCDPFFNANTPDDLTRLRILMKE